jgi:DNA polymerase-3 subunit gamma/tau
MTYIALTRRYRPQTFDEVVGQEHVTTTLKNAIKRGRISHAYLFAGSRGVGKTTTARILAEALNCESGPTPTPCGKCNSCREIANSASVDVYEIDGASNRGIDEVRSLRESVRYAPSRGRYKIYIIDEVHMLTTEAFNALLKTLEEPPKHVVFIFATTQPNKVVPTIVSRCQRFDFRRLSEKDILSRIEFITGSEKITIDKEAAVLIARRADGSIRDAESILDQLASYSGDSIKKSHIVAVLGICEAEFFFALLEAFMKSDTKRCLEIVNEVVDIGHDLHQFVLGLIEHLRLLLIVRLKVDTGEARSLTEEELQRYTSQASSLYPEDIVRMLNIGCRLEIDMRRSAHPRSTVEAAMVRLSKLGSTVLVKDLLKRIERLEKSKVELDIDGMRQEWPKFVNSVQSEDARMGEWLAEADLRKLEGDRLTIGISRTMDREMKKSTANERSDYFTHRLCEYFGRKFRVDFLVADAPAQHPHSRTMREDSIVKTALELFEGEIRSQD